VKMVLNAGLLRREMTKKGLDGKALSKAAKVAPSVISNALKGNPVRLRSGTQIVYALRSAPDLEGVDDHWPDTKTATSFQAVAVDEEDERDSATSS
jgi:hypothetical protein